MIAKKIRYGETIGLVSPSHLASVERYKPFISAIEAKGFKVKTSGNFYKNTYGYSSTEYERPTILII